MQAPEAKRYCVERVNVSPSESGVGGVGCDLSELFQKTKLIDARSRARNKWANNMFNAASLTRLEFNSEILKYDKPREIYFTRERQGSGTVLFT